MGAFWVRSPYADLLGPGTHGSTYGGTPLACAVALKIFEVVEREKLDEHARKLGDWLKNELERLAKKYPGVVKNTRGIGFMLGFELAEKIPAFASSDKSAAVQFTIRLQQAGVLVIPAGTQVIRLLPALNLRPTEAEEGLKILESAIAKLAG